MNNYGDEILLRSSLKFFKESEIEEVLLLFPRTGSRKIGGIKINHVNRNSVISIISAIKNSDIVVGGGGNVFQDETSKRSFIYYSFLLSVARFFKKKIILLGHGIGKINYSCDFRRMAKILSDDSTTGIFRDQISYRYSRKHSKKHLLGTDLSYGFLRNREKIKPAEGKLGIIVKSDWPEIEDMIQPLKNEGISEIVLLVTMPEQELKYANRLEKVLKGHFDVLLKIGEVNEITDLISSCSLIITERLHGAIVASFFGIPFLSKGSFKIKAYFNEFRKYNAFFNDKGPSEIGKALGNLRKIDFEKLNTEFVENNIKMYDQTLLSFKNIIVNLKLLKGG